MTVNEDKVRQRAHDLWDQAGRPEGRDVEFWLRAEAELADNGKKDAKVVAKKSVKPKEDKAKASASLEAAPAKGKPKKK